MNDFDKAVEAMKRDAIRTGAVIMLPSREDSELIRGVWYMRNNYGFLCRVGNNSGKVF